LREKSIQLDFFWVALVWEFNLGKGAAALLSQFDVMSRAACVTIAIPTTSSIYSYEELNIAETK
jgi:hypothetical protein